MNLLSTAHIRPAKILWLQAVLLCVLVVLSGCGGDTTGQLQGVVRLQNQTTFEGITIYLPGTQFRAMTDEEGGFIITGIPPGVYTLVAETEGFFESRQQVTITEGKTTTVETVSLPVDREPSGRISGIISLTGETIHADIAILLVGTSYSTFTSTTGYFEFPSVPPGEYQVMAFKEDWLPYTTEPILLQDQAEVELPPMQLERNPTLPTPTPDVPTLGNFMLTGRAFLEGETTHAGIRVFLPSMPSKFTLTSATGFFEFTGLSQGPFTLQFARAGFIPERVNNVLASELREMSDIGFVNLQREFNPERLGIVQGRIFLEGLNEHANTLVRLQGVSQSVVTDLDGRYMFIGVPEGVYTLTAEHPGFETTAVEDVTVSPESIFQVPEMTLIPTSGSGEDGTGSISGVALLEDDSDHGGITVALEGTSLSTVTSANGDYILEQVPFGAYTLIFTRGGYTNEYAQGVPVDVDTETIIDPVVLRPDIEPPVVLETFPSPNARRVPIDGWVNVLVRFSERMNGESVKQSVIVEPPVSFEAFFDRESDLSDMDVLHVRLPQESPNPVQFNTRYQVTILPDAQTPQGIRMEEPFSFGFTTDGPLIVNTVPESGNPRIVMQPNQPLLIETNVPVDPLSFERAIRFRPNPDSQPLFEYRQEGARGYVLISATLRPGTQYRVSIDNAVRGVNGLRFSNTPYTFTFRTWEMGDRRRQRRR